jgi:hypothetical protein
MGYTHNKKFFLLPSIGNKKRKKRKLMEERKERLYRKDLRFLKSKNLLPIIRLRPLR